MGEFPTTGDFEGGNRDRDRRFEDEGEEKQGGSEASSSFVLRSTSTQMASHYQDMKEPVLAATSYLASDEIQEAMKILRSEDIVLAYALTLATGMDNQASTLKCAEERFGTSTTFIAPGRKKSGRKKSLTLPVENKEED